MFLSRYQDLIQSLKESEMQVESQFQAQIDHLLKAEKRIVKFLENVEFLAVHAHRMREDHLEAKERTYETTQR